jgi:hypothetical protein
MPSGSSRNRVLAFRKGMDWGIDAPGALVVFIGVFAFSEETIVQKTATL